MYSVVFKSSICAIQAMRDEMEQGKPLVAKYIKLRIAEMYKEYLKPLGPRGPDRDETTYRRQLRAFKKNKRQMIQNLHGMTPAARDKEVDSYLTLAETCRQMTEVIRRGTKQLEIRKPQRGNKQLEIRNHRQPGG